MKSGTLRHVLDRRDYSLSRTFKFGAVGPLENRIYTYDIGLTMPDQIADGLPQGCTGYSQADIKGMQDKAEYVPRYTYIRTCEMEGHPATEPCDMRVSKKSLRVYGAQIKGEDEAHAIFHRGLPYFNVDRVSGYDWFDSFRLGLRKGRPISTGTPWPREWEMVNSTGIVTEHFVVQDNTPWHNYAIVGETVISGIPYLVAKSWQGKNYGDHGWCYIGREAFNKSFDIYGTIGLVDADPTGKDIQLIILDLQQTLMMYVNRLLAIIGVQKTIHA